MVVTLQNELFYNSADQWLFIFGIIIGLPVTVFVHEAGHYLAYIFYGGKPRFGHCGKWRKKTFFVTSAYGDDFFWDLFNRDRSKAWLKEMVISGSALLANLFAAAICLVLAFYSAKIGNITVFLILIVNAVYHFVFFFVNYTSSLSESDGFKVRAALKHRAGYVDYLEEIGYQFTPDEQKQEVARFQELYWAKRSTVTYVFLIIDKGLCQKVIIEPEMNRLAMLARMAIENYLLINGQGDEDQEELATEDGYAKIVRVTPGIPDSEEHIWSYSFDGEISLNYAFNELLE